MLKLNNIVKDYVSGDSTVHALRGVSIEFRDNEFVAILGQSGCGKTTLLNILGGLDRYTSGDLIINGRSTKDYSEHDWDTYRNHSIGFVFQSYNLIPHQTVLANVELALTLSGVSKSERRRRAKEALTRVGLSDQFNKKPNQLSGGQMQRVAIARAIVNDPEILLADEPTGALDSETSVQVMDLLTDIAKDRLVIMVTHNGELAEQYATRTVRLLDGQIISDSQPYDSGKQVQEPVGKRRRKKDKSEKKTSMSFRTALSLSLNNLMTKKTRTLLTSFAGSIGIIGIALILSMSSGFQNYIDRVQEDTLSGYPIMIEKSSVDMTSLMTTMMEATQENTGEDDGKVHTKSVLTGMMSMLFSEVQENDLAAFRSHLESNREALSPYLNAVKYGYRVSLNVYNPETKEQINPSNLFQSMGFNSEGSELGGSSLMSGGLDVWSEMLDNKELLQEQYDVVQGRWPEAKDEIVLLVDDQNEITDFALFSLGLKDKTELQDMVMSIRTGTDYTPVDTVFTYDELMAIRYRLVLPTDYFEKVDGVWVDRSGDPEFLADKIDNGLELKVVGILRPADSAVSTAVTGTVGYLSSLTDYIISYANASEIVTEQRANPETDVFTGKQFGGEIDISSLTPEQQQYLASLSAEERAQLLASMSSGNTFKGNLRKLSAPLPEEPDYIYLYAVDFAGKEELTAFIDRYNSAAEAEGKDERVIHYTDYVGLMMSSVSTIIDAISYVLIGFVGVSLVVSSIMIGIITYISVLERTKEIGILRSIGARSRDISRVFNAETLIVGFVAGLLGILVTLLLCIPINAIISSLANIPHVAALPPLGGVILVVISMVLTLIAGLIPARIASKRDPVIALRTE